MTDGLTREDLRDLMRDMKEEVRDGFKGVHDRLDELNGRTRKAENLLAVHEERWQRLDKATSVRGSSASRDDDAGVKGEWKALTGVGLLLGGALSGLLLGLAKVAQIIGSVIK